MKPSEQVQQAYLQLCWAIKVDRYLLDHLRGNEIDFDSPLTIDDPTDPLFLPGDQFNTVEDIYLCAMNCICQALGALFLALDTALNQAGIRNDPSAKDSDGQLRILIYMGRCAFAHNVLAPHWNVYNEYCRQLDITLPGGALHIDMNKLSDKPFDINQIGGYSQLFKIKEYVLQVLSVPATNLWLNPMPTYVAASQ